MPMIRRFFVANAILLFGCADREPTSQTLITREQSVEAFPLTDLVGVDSLRLVMGDEVYAIGGTAPLGDDYLSDALRGAIWRGANVVLSDLRQRILFFVDSTGRAMRFARTGEGPGEVMHPTALLPWSAGRFAILDTQLQRFSIFELASPPRFIASHQSSGYPNGTCATDSSYYGVDFDREDQRLIGEYFPGGGSPRRFGQPLVAGSNLRNNSIRQGPLICAPESHLLWLAPFTGELLAYDMRGELRMRLRVPEHEDGAWIEREGTIGFQILAADRDRSRLPMTMTTIGVGIAVLQLQEYRRAATGAAPERGQVISILFDTGSGRRLGTQVDLPRILAASPAFLLLQVGEDEPQVRLVRYEVATP